MKKIIPFIFVFLAMLIWGTSFLVMKTTLDNINAGFMIFSRGILTVICLLPLAFKYLKDFKIKDLLFILLTGSIVAVGYLVQAIGLKYTTPGNSAFLEDAYCIVVPIFTCILLKKKPTILNIICIVLCLSGIILISVKSLTYSINVGDVLSIIAGVMYGFNITLTGLYAKKYNALAYTFLQFVVITMISGLYTLIFENNSQLVFNINSILSLLYLGIVVTALAWVFRNLAQRELSPITISIILPFTAVVGSIISIIAKQDVISLPFIFGGLLIVISILLDAIIPNIKRKAEV